MQSIQLAQKENDRVELRCQIDPESVSGIHENSSTQSKILEFVWQLNGTTIVNDTATKQSLLRHEQNEQQTEWQILPTGFRRQRSLNWNEDILTIPTDKALLYGQFVCWAVTASQATDAFDRITISDIRNIQQFNVHDEDDFSTSDNDAACHFHLLPFGYPHNTAGEMESTRRHHHHLHSQHHSSSGLHRHSLKSQTSLLNCGVIESSKSVIIDCDNQNRSFNNPKTDTFNTNSSKFHYHAHPDTPFLCFYSQYHFYPTAFLFHSEKIHVLS